MSTTGTGRRGRDGEGGAAYLRKGVDTLSFPLNRTALLVIDPVNDFLSEGLAAARWRSSMVRGRLRSTREGRSLRDVLRNERRGGRRTTASECRSIGSRSPDGKSDRRGFLDAPARNLKLL